MYSMRQLNKAIDSFTKENNRVRNQLQNNCIHMLPFTKFIEYGLKASYLSLITGTRLLKAAKSFNELIAGFSKLHIVHNGPLSQVNSLRCGISNHRLTILKKRKRDYESIR